MNILGISAYYHDSAATVIKDGDIIAAAQEERFTRVKQDAGFPFNAITYCLKEAGIGVGELDKIVFYDDPKVKYKRIKKTYVDFFPKSIPFIFKSYPVWSKKKQYWKENLIKEFEEKFSVKISPDMISNSLHHRSHAASAFFPSPFEEAAVLVLDGVGEFDTTSVWVGKKNKLEKVMSIEFPHSLGLLYSAVTYYTGFKVNSGEYKIMGLAPYGEPKYVDIMKKHLVKINDDGTFQLDMKYFDFATGSQMTNSKFHKLFSKEPREPESQLSQFEMDMARSIQEVTEEIMLKLSKTIREKTGMKFLCLAGGVALNCVGNGKILQSKNFDDIWIQPAAGDAGGSLGCALDYYFDICNNERHVDENDSMKGAYLGPRFSDEEIESYLKSVNAKFTKIDDEKLLINQVTDALTDEKVVGWHQGRMEFGPRALGNRSIIGDSRSTKMQKVMNLKIKYRESFRPFAPSVLIDDVNEWFEIDSRSPYMLLVADVKQKRIKLMSSEEEKLFGIDKLRIIRSEIPSVTHVDYSARVQTVHRNTNKRYYDLISQFKERTNCPVIVNTSFNVRGEPIVCTPEDSYRCFMRTEMDVLVIDNYLLFKEEQPSFVDNVDWKKEFELD